MDFYVLKLELNIKNVMVFTVLEGDKPVAVILIEDKRRKGELFLDFDFLYPRYYESEAEWDDFRNFIKAMVFVLEEVYLEDAEKKDLLGYIPEAMVENKPSVNPRIDVVFDKTISDAFHKSEEDRNGFLNCLLSFTEAYRDSKLKAIEDESHLTQRLIDQHGNVIE